MNADPFLARKRASVHYVERVVRELMLRGMDSLVAVMPKTVGEFLPFTPL